MSEEVDEDSISYWSSAIEKAERDVASKQNDLKFAIEYLKALEAGARDAMKSTALRRFMSDV